MTTSSSNATTKLITTLTILFALTGMAAAAQDTVTLHDSAQGADITGTSAQDGETVYVKVTDGSTTTGGTNTVSVTSPNGGSISVTVNDDGNGDDNSANDGNYWGNFTVTSGTTDDGTDILSVDDANDATVNADLDGNSDGDSASITADYTAPSIDSGTTVQAGTQNGGTSKIDVTFTEAGSGLDSSTIDPSDFSIGGTTLDGTGESVVVNSNTVTITYDTSDASSLGTGDTPDVGVVGSISDNAGNTVSSGSITPSDGISPVVESVSFSQDPISDSNTDQTVTVEYSETMDSNTNPTVTFNGVSVGSVSNTGWSQTDVSSDTYQATYSVDDGQEASNVDVTIDGAQDDTSTNVQVSKTSSTTFNVDRVNPSISDAEVTAPQEVTVTFDENVYASSGAAGQDSDDLAAADFAYQDDSSGGATDVSSVTQGSSHSEWVLTLDAPVENADLGQDDITLGDSVFDSVANELTTSAASTVVVDDSNTDDVEPTVTNFDTTVSGSDITIQVDSDESLSNIDVSAEGGTVSNSEFEDTGTNEYEATYTPGSDGTYTVTLNSVTDGTNQVTFSSRTSDSTVDQNGPTGGNFNPTDGATVTDNQKQITVDLSDAGTSVSSVDSVTLTDGSDSVIGGVDSVTTSNEHVSTSGSDPVTVTIDPSATGGDGSSFTYPEGTVNVDMQATDGSSNSNTVSYDFTVDTEAPSITSAETKSTNTVEVTLSDDTSNVDTATIEAGDFQVNGNSVTISSTFPDANSGSVIGTLKLSDGSFSTGATPDVSIVSGSSGISDVPGNKVDSQTFEGTTDGVAPTVNSRAYSDSDNDGEVDQIDVTYSETLASGAEAADYSITGSDSGQFDSVDSASVNGDTVELSVTANTVDTGPSITLDYTPTGGSSEQITDDASSPNAASDFSGDSVSDSAAPVLQYAEINHGSSTDSETTVTLEFTETVADDNAESDGIWIDGNAFDLGTSAETHNIAYGSVLQTGESPLVNMSDEVDDGSGNSAVNMSGNDVEVDTFRKDLSSGWNFVSFPIAGTSSPDVSSVLGDTSNVNAVWKYTSDGWESWTPSSSNEDDFSTVSGGEGYLVDVDTGYTVGPNVNNVQTTQAPAQVQLSEGYNLVGQFEEFNQKADTGSTDGAFASLGGSFWKAHSQSSGLVATEMADSDDVLTGSAYWVQTQGDLSDGSIAYTAN